jgi:hypothetical protein
LSVVHSSTDLESDLHIQSVPNELLTPLHSLIKRPRFLDGDASPRDDDFHPLQPSLQLFLSGNSLSILPSELFNLENITVLSLRNNNLEALSPHLSRLHNLVELNTAGNALRFLPWELLALIRRGTLQSMTVLPNPLLRPFAYDGFLHDATPIACQWAPPRSKAQLDSLIKALTGKLVELRESLSQPRPVARPAADVASASVELKHTSWMLELLQGYVQAFRVLIKDLLAKNVFALTDAVQTVDDLWAQIAESGHSTLDVYPNPIFIASTSVTRFRSDGLLPMGLRQDSPPSQLPSNTEILSATPGGAPIPSQGSRVPSLFELSATSASTVTELPSLRTLLPDDAPRPVLRTLEIACQVREEGGRICSVCRRNYIIPRTEWVEYWHLPPKYGQRSSREEMFWPFLRRGCSLGCLPQFPAR